QDRPGDSRKKSHALAGDVGVFINIGAAANRNVSLHPFHTEKLKVTRKRGVLLVSMKKEFALKPGVACFEDRRGSGGTGGTRQFNPKLVGNVDEIEKDMVTALERGGVLNQKFSQF